MTFGKDDKQKTGSFMKKSNESKIYSFEMQSRKTYLVLLPVINVSGLNCIPNKFHQTNCQQIMENYM